MNEFNHKIAREPTIINENVDLNDQKMVQISNMVITEKTDIFNLSDIHSKRTSELQNSSLQKQHQ